MAPGDRRQAIVEATLPLLLSRGPELSTREIAQAAGVAEGTIFRAFPTKGEIIEAAVRQALRPVEALATIEALPKDHSLTERVEAVLETLVTEIQRTRSLIIHLAGVGVQPERPHPPTHGQGHHHANHDDSRWQLFHATTAALEPYAGQLSVTPLVATKLLSALAFAASFPLSPDESNITPHSMASVALHGIAEGEE